MGDAICEVSSKNYLKRLSVNMLNSKKMLFPVALLALYLTATACFADVKLPALLSDHMVLQRDKPVPIWGWAEPGEKIIVAIGGQTHETQANEEGRWRVELTPLDRKSVV